mmetsp:Transcript_147076/g.273911  ORF Transcript_147076/g.273911 Transcript_147076/m.273911 type:complete len:243 (-) Transcript_147076:66-794(-)
MCIMTSLEDTDSMTVIVSRLDGSEVKMGLRRNLEVKQVKDLIEDKLSIPWYEQHLCLCDEELNNDSVMPETANGEALTLSLVRVVPDKDDWISRVSEDPQSLRNAPPPIKADHAVIQAAAVKDGSSLKHASAEVMTDHDFLLPLVQKNGWALRHLPADIQADRSIVLAAVQSVGQVLRYASKQLKGDTELVLAAIAQDARAAMYGSPELFADPEFVRMALTTNRNASVYIASLRCRLGRKMA